MRIIGPDILILQKIQRLKFSVFKLKIS